MSAHIEIREFFFEISTLFYGWPVLFRFPYCVRSQSVDCYRYTSFLPRSLPTSIGINRKRCGLRNLPKAICLESRPTLVHPSQYRHPRGMGTYSGMRLRGRHILDLWHRIRGATALVKLPLRRFPRWFIYSLDVAVSLNFAVLVSWY